MQSLSGYFLIATPQMTDPRFREQVVYLCAHSEDEGAMGLVINNPLQDVTLADVLRSANIEPPEFSLPPVYIGGPVEMECAFFLLSNYKTDHCLQVTGTVSISREVRLLHEIAQGRGPQEYIFLLGYAGWAPGQLEEELKRDGWLTLPASEEVLFRTPATRKWKQAARLYGIDIETFGDIVGNA